MMWIDPAPPATISPVSPPRCEAVVIRPTTATHCFSACLYHEPEFKKRFPGRNYANRYLHSMQEVIPHFRARNFALNIFADEAMLETALSFGFGSVYCVRDKPPFPFAQHVYRYYSALLPEHPTIRAYHFRGMDNLVPSDPFMAVLERFVGAGGEILHAPYLRARGLMYMPIRGSCSVANGGISNLARFLRTTPLEPPTQPWPEGWHCDEHYLARWFKQERLRTRIHTIVDRPLPFEFHAFLHDQIAAGGAFELVRVEAAQ